MTKKTTILCGHERHTITFHGDGTVTSSGCNDEVQEKARKVAALARLRHEPISILNTGGCVALVALVEHGVPQLLQQQTPGPYVDLGSWRAIYNRFEGNQLVKQAMDETRRKRDAEHAEAFVEARKAMRKTRYRTGWSRGDIDEMTSFLPNQPMTVDTQVAVGNHDHFCVPLQEGWLENVAKAGIAVVSNKFVVGVDIDNPRRVFAIAQSPKTGFFVVRPFELQTRPLRLKPIREVA